MPNPYNIEKEDGGYYFTTDLGVKYFAYFDLYDLYFTDFPLISHYYFTFNFEVKDLNGYKKTPKDIEGRTKDTISYLLGEFFKDTDRALIIICDSTDRKHKARKKMFDDWYDKNVGIMPLDKYDGYNANEDMEVFSSLIVNKNHLFKDEIVDAYESVRTALFKSQ